MADKIENYIRGGTQKSFYAESEVTSVKCPSCDLSGHKLIYKERGSLGIVRCLSCGLIYTNPRLNEPEKIYWGDVQKYYEEARLIFEGRLEHHRDPNYLADLKLINKYRPSGNFLDIGTNMGFFLRKAKGWGWRIYGVEPSPSLSDMARKYFGLDVKTAFLQEAGFESDFFDVVTLTDVFEHLTDPKKMLNEARRVLKPEGIIFIKVPNGLFNIFKLIGAGLMGRLKNYDIFDSYEHVVHYTQKTISIMLEQCGFKVLNLYIGKPIQLPVWHKYVGQFYLYPTPWLLDFKRQSARTILYVLSLIERKIRLNHIGYLAPNIIVIAKKEK